ncbi:MAG: Dipicolinate synthase subunit B [Firmicutes bacterium ADurb.Bin193]|nr:MAG: Dipicolinate synthase subunit B [Firmicutes bacterium ADurb.Bin193]
MELKNARIGFALTGSFCTIPDMLVTLEELVGLCADVIPIMSEIVYTTDTRFFNAKDLIRHVEEITKKEVIHSIKAAEPIGPQKLMDALVIAPCTGNTLSKIANGINDTTVTMASKAHLRNKRPLIIAVSTNDGLGINAKNIGQLLSVKNIFFVPFSQDDAVKKPNSLIAKPELVIPTIAEALKGEQLQPVLYNIPV